MTIEKKEKLIRHLRYNRSIGADYLITDEDADEIIKALEQEPCDDAISRQIISDYVESHIQEINTGYGDLNKHTNEILRMIVDYIEKMKPVTSQPNNS